MKLSMLYKMIRNDISKNKVTMATIMVFIIASTMLVTLAIILSINLLGSIDTLMQRSKTPHFMQMHSGAIDHGRLDLFSKTNDKVEQYQVSEFLNMEGSQIKIKETSLKDSVQDNGVCTQSVKFDYLLDLEGNVIKVSDGEIYVPISYKENKFAKIGDTINIYEKRFLVKGFLRDSQMNSLLASSKRFLVSEADFQSLKYHGNIEYLIEYRLKKLSLLGTFEKDYSLAGLEANGPTITYPLYKTMNGISDGILIAIMLLIGFLIIGISFLCIRFTLLAKIEEDYREIGMMKALGLRLSQIKLIYLSKYGAISAVGSILGFLLALTIQGIFMKNIRLYMGESEYSRIAPFYGGVGVILIFIIILTYVHYVLKQFRRISAAQALRYGISLENPKKENGWLLSRKGFFPTNVFLGIKDVIIRKKLYLVMLAILVISVFIIIVPMNLYHTISSKNFITYMGVGECDIRIDLQQMNQLSNKAVDVTTTLKKDKSVDQYAILTTKNYNIILDNNTTQRIKIELGNHNAFPIRYTSGRNPNNENEIALSHMNADELSKKVGDTITIEKDGTKKPLSVCGIYSDVTNGGKTSKAIFTDDSKEAMWYVIYVKLSAQSTIPDKIGEYNKLFPYAKISSIHEYVHQTFGTTMQSVGKAAIGACILAFTMTLFITLLFMKMILIKDRYDIAVMKTLGFANSDIKLQYITRSLLILVLGIGIGTLLANTFGEVIAGMMISQVGASSFRFHINPIAAYLLAPMMMAGVVLIATILVTSKAGEIKLSEQIKE